MILFEYMTDMINFHAQRITVGNIFIYFDCYGVIKEKEYYENDHPDRMFFDASIEMRANLEYKFLKVTDSDISYEEVFERTKENAEMKNILKPSLIVSLHEMIFEGE